MKYINNCSITLTILFSFISFDFFSILAQSKQFMLTDSLIIPRAKHTMITLKDSNVLVIGGLNEASMVCEIYDHKKNVWSLADTINILRSGPQAALLGNGDVLIVGGSFDKKYEIYDFATQSWILKSEISFQRVFGHTLSNLLNGKVLLIGGYAFNDFINTEYLNKCEIYDPENDSWYLTDSLNLGRIGHTATLLNDGRVLVCGGIFKGLYLKSCEIYDPIADKWTVVDSLQEEREGHTATLLPNGKVLIVGGRNEMLLSLKSCELFDPVLNKWERMNHLSLPRTYHFAFLISEDEILLADGKNFEIYNFFLFKTELSESMLNERMDARFAQINQATILQAGGYLWQNEMFLSSRMCSIFDTITDIMETKTAKKNIQSSARFYPNPFNSSALLEFHNEIIGKATVKLYNLLGEEIATLLSDGDAQNGTIRVNINNLNITSGVYFLVIQKNNSIETLTIINNK